MLVAAVQHDIVWESPDDNFSRLAPRVREAAETGARLVALTETFSNGFSMATDRIAESAEGPSTTFLLEQAETTGAWVCGSIPVAPEPGHLPTNCLVLAGPDGTVHRYAKRHRFTYAGEDEHYAAGAGTTTVTIEGVRFSLFVCFDLRFAPDFWTLAEQTDAYLVIANWPAARRQHWLSLLQARAIENQAYVVGVNRVGRGDGVDYTGDSRVFDPLGERLAAGPAGEEAIITAEVDPAVVADVRNRFPFLADRGPALP